MEQKRTVATVASLALAALLACSGAVWVYSAVADVAAEATQHRYLVAVSGMT